MEISKPYWPLLVSVIQDSMEYNKIAMEMKTNDDLADYEEYLLALEEFSEYVKEKYEKLQKEHSDVIEYSELIRKPGA